MQEIKVDDITINTIPIINDIWTYFNKKANDLDAFIVDRHFKKSGFYEIVFREWACFTMRVYFTQKNVKLIWLKYGTDGEGEIESDERCELVYNNYNIDRETSLSEFNKFYISYNKIVIKKQYIPQYEVMEKHLKKMEERKAKENSLSYDDNSICSKLTRFLYYIFRV